RFPPRIAVLIALLAGAAAWVAIDLRRPAAPTSAKAPASGAPQDPEHVAASASEAKQPGIPARSALGRIAADPFSAQAWLPRRKPAVVSEPPVAVVPPLPYRFAGQFHRDSGIEVYVARGEEIFPVKEGDTLDGQYKVDSVSATEVSFVHIPSGTRQTLQFSALKEQELTGQGGPPQAKTPASASDAEMLVLTFKSIRAAEAAEISVASLNLQGAAGRTIAYNGLTPFRTTITP